MERIVMEYIFKVTGEPVHFYSQRETRSKGWGTFKEQRIKWMIALEGQLNDKLLNKPVDVDVHIYCKTGAPMGRLSSYAKFIESLFSENFFVSLDIIYSLSVYKHFVKSEPYSILTIKER